MGSSHAAGGQALGYVYQCLWGLVELGRRAVDAPTIELRLEALDDIQFDSAGSPTELLQTKHTVDASAVLTVNSTQLWRTMNVWIDNWVEDEDWILRLCTVSSIADGDDLAALRDEPNGRDVEVALTAIEGAAKESDNKTTASWRKKFSALSPAKRHALISAIQIQDRNPSAAEIDEALRVVFRWAIKRGQEDAFLVQLKGWWTGVSVELLSGKRPSVNGLELSAELEDIIDRFHPENLPIHPDIQFLNFTEPDAEGYSDALFVQQLKWIAVDNPRLWKAVRDYHRAFVQRSEWLKEQQVSETELSRYAFALHDEWEFLFDECCERMTIRGASAEETGREVLNKLCQEAKSKLRPRFDAGWFLRGTVHQMANGETPYSIGWHPEFLQRVKTALVVNA